MQYKSGADMAEIVQDLMEAGLPPPFPAEFRVSDVAATMDVEPEYLQAFLNLTKPVDSWLAIKLAEYTKTSTEFWLNLQSMKDIADRRR
jgi:plasmid maintenance system antidote protein VapI